MTMGRRGRRRTRTTKRRKEVGWQLIARQCQCIQSVDREGCGPCVSSLWVSASGSAVSFAAAAAPAAAPTGSPLEIVSPNPGQPPCPHFALSPSLSPLTWSSSSNHPYSHGTPWVHRPSLSFTTTHSTPARSGLLCCWADRRACTHFFSGFFFVETKAVCFMVSPRSQQGSGRAA